MRIPHIDTAKGVCMILVVMCHAGGVGNIQSIYPEACWLFMLPCFLFFLAISIGMMGASLK